MQIPVEIPERVQVDPHQRFVGVRGREQLVEEANHLLLILPLVQIRRHRRHVDALSPVVGSSLLQALEKHGDAVFGGWFPAQTQQTPHVVGQRVLLGQRHVDHWQHGTLAVEDTVQNAWQDDIVDVVGVTEFSDVLCAQLRRRAVQVAWG